MIYLKRKAGLISVVIILSNYLSFAQSLEDQQTKLRVNIMRGGIAIESIITGDHAFIKLKNKQKLTGRIAGMDQEGFLVGQNNVLLNNVWKIRKSKNRALPITIGIISVLGGLIVFNHLSFGTTDFNDIPLLGGLGIGLITSGIIAIKPGWHKIGRSKSIVVSSY